MKFRSTRFAPLAAALMISAPLALAATPTFAADYHDNDNNYRGDNDRHDGDRSNYHNDNDRHDSYRSNRHDNDRGGDRDGHGMRHMSYRHSGHWGYSHGHHMWFAAFFVR